jgi:hypothetical protein
MPNGFSEVKSSKREAAVLPGSYSLGHRGQKGEKVKLSLARSLLPCHLDLYEGAKRYSPAECIGALKHRIEGNPDPKYVSTSYAERSNLSVRMHTRRFTRLTNAFSKKVENHAHSVALFAMYYNFVRIHKTLRTTPAMAAGMTKRLWEVADIVSVLEVWEQSTAPTSKIANRLPRTQRGNMDSELNL